MRLARGSRFAVRYALIAGGLLSLYAFPFELFGATSDPLEGYLQAFARIAGGALRLFDAAVSVRGTLIDGRFPLQVARNCDAAEVNILFAGAVLALPAPWRWKLLRVVIGLCLLVTANVARICALYFVGVYRASWFRSLHEEVFPLALVALGALSFVALTRSPTSELDAA